MLGQGLHQARVHHAEGVRQALVVVVKEVVVVVVEVVVVLMVEVVVMC